MAQRMVDRSMVPVRPVSIQRRRLDRAARVVENSQLLTSPFARVFNFPKCPNQARSEANDNQQKYKCLIEFRKKDIGSKYNISSKHAIFLLSLSRDCQKNAALAAAKWRLHAPCSSRVPSDALIGGRLKTRPAKIKKQIVQFYKPAARDRTGQSVCLASAPPVEAVTQTLAAIGHARREPLHID
jgi:hypothetical protein